MDKPFALIVEDNRDIVALFRHVLDMAGYHTEIVLDGREAMERIQAVHPDILLLDLQLPGMTGVEILKQMRTDENLANIPVVVITAYPNYTDKLPFKPDLLLLKPVDVYQLSDLVRRLQAARGTPREPALDAVSGLYTLTFFKERLTFSLERIKQAALRKFGILFADIVPMEAAAKEMRVDDLRSFQRRLADQFKSTLRPTDTMAWSSEGGYFLAVFEELPSTEMTAKIAGRIQDGLNAYLENQPVSPALHSNLGILICDAEYKDIDKIMADVDAARSILRNGEYPSPAVFDRKIILTQK
jgi:CheY-like chemotaxis protein